MSELFRGVKQGPLRSAVPNLFKNGPIGPSIDMVLSIGQGQATAAAAKAARAHNLMKGEQAARCELSSRTAAEKESCRVV